LESRIGVYEGVWGYTVGEGVGGLE
jgi:hypothetical protein